jgi:integrase
MRKRARDVYRRGDVTLGWRKRIAVADYRDESGKRRRRNLGQISQAEAEKAIDVFAEARAAVKKQRASYLVRDLWRLWLVDREKDGLSNAIYDANWVALEPHFGSRSPPLITADDCRDYSKARFALGISPWTVNTELSRLNACLKWAAIKSKLITPADRPYIWMPSRGKGRQRVLTFAEAEALIRGARDFHVYLFILLAITTGARHTAMLDLTWDRVDFDRDTIQYDEDEERDPMSKRWRKGRATVPMGAVLRRELLRAHAARQTEHVIEHGGRRLKSIREGFANAAMRAGLGKWITHPKTGEPVFKPDVSPHTIRHSVSTWLRERGVRVEDRAQLLGHADTKTTELNYTHAGSDVLKPAVEIIDGAIGALPQKDVPTRVAHPPRRPKKRLLSNMDKPTDPPM